MTMTKISSTLLLILLCALANAQEGTTPLLQNHLLDKKPSDKKTKIVKRSTPITLPLWEDFSYCDDQVFPTDHWWVDSSTYINNHFVAEVINKGVATFDVLDAQGKPYHSEPWEQLYCDSLTSYFVDLRGYDDADSIYLSFAYLCGGLGFKPKASDSLLIFFEDEINGWVRAGHVRMDTSSGWKYTTFGVRGGNYFYENFRFRIVNKGTVGTSSSHWHLDNIYLNSGRNFTDTVYTDLAFTEVPTNLLKDFTAMPFRHFQTDRNAFAADQLSAYTRYNSSGMGGAATNIHYRAQNGITGTVYGSGTISSIHPASVTLEHSFPRYNVSALSTGSDGRLLIDHYFYTDPGSGDTTRGTDTIRQRQIFDNYFAYDDGSAEQAYYLNLAPMSPGKIAIEFAAYVPDTLAGVAIQFARQIPGSEEKEFFIQIYKEIELGGSGGELIYEEQGFFPQFPEGNQQFYTYPLAELVPLSTGIFHVVIMMPASGISDSLMVALDKNRQGANHRYFSVLDVWESSLMEGALMVRPVMGNQLLTAIPESDYYFADWKLYPNPTQDIVYIEPAHDEVLDQIKYRIIDIQGKEVQQGNYDGTGISVQSLGAGSYIFIFENKAGLRSHLTFIKK